MDPVLTTAAALAIIVMIWQIIKLFKADYRSIARELRLRRRGRGPLHRRSLALTLGLFIPKLRCHLGSHYYPEQMKYLKRLAPGHELTCERWFCPEFSDAPKSVRG